MRNKYKIVSGLLLMWASFNATTALAENEVPEWAINPPQGTASYCTDILYMGKEKGILVAKTFASNMLNNHELGHYVEGAEGIHSSSYHQDILTAKVGLQKSTKIIKQYINDNNLCVLVAHDA
ncbi:hypothetical protein GLP21_12390 [Photobacterium carnosum]|uniref:Uncharacterized protein n=1 Tax=Photobacterium carnosum TaxID=2023717 RepID=A0A2N4UW59_9GAMM|nr:MULTISPECIES: hypothetical protein [Photobacterium]MCD9475865.1 hypothetical protein [Photobacterium phosphoreum]MCD9485916.1 hypothetical protein [Photobacterium iliopiscarium]MCD9507727.1 hypothetical protein [Photobacterium phosphoreum]MCD9538152.1 hypothetical protein [Photobacterium carnosum]MCD9542561.1 hypothetical protein [Photobacterium carnosum]